MADIFISYARLDRERVAPLKQALDGLGLNSFFDIDGLDGGDTFPDVLDREVKNAKVVLGCWTPHALQRDWVKAECAIAHEQKTLVPLEFDPLGPIDVPAAFFRLQRVNVSTWRGESKHDGWLSAIRAISRRLHRPDIYDRAQAAAALSASGRLVSDRPAHDMDSLWSDWTNLALTTDRDELESLRVRAEGTLIAQLCASRIKDLSRPAAARFLTGSEAVGLPPLRGWRLARFVALRAGIVAAVAGGGLLAYSVADRRAEAAILLAGELEEKAADLEGRMSAQQEEALRQTEALQAQIAERIAEAEAVRAALTQELEGMEASIRLTKDELERNAEELARERDSLATQLLALRSASTVGVYTFRPHNEFMRDHFEPRLQTFFDILPPFANYEQRKSTTTGQYEKALASRADLFSSYEINTPMRLAAFLGQLAVETGWFRFRTESLNYSEQGLIQNFSVYRRNPELAKEHARKPELIANTVYAGRLGNTEPGDGWKFRGRGMIQITGRAQYARVSELLGIDLVENPDLLTSDDTVALAAAAVMWVTWGMNEYADKWEIEKISRQITRGDADATSAAHDEDLRILWSNRALQIMSREDLSTGSPVD
ncbi:MAG: TIR domain-containing protein [Hyphomonas sp.]